MRWNSFSSRIVVGFAIAATAVACGSSVDKKPPPATGGNNGGSSNSGTNNGGANNGGTNTGGTNNGGTNNGDGTNNGPSGVCGDGVLDPGELCDTAITEGTGACPTSCQAPACSTASLVGSACAAQCIVEPIACADGDGCCPGGCDSSTDSDCSNVCGDGIVDAPELCDGDCPASCDDGVACTTDTLVGNAATCDAQCRFETVSACVDGDGCCPSGCTGSTDDDCQPEPQCGDGSLDPGELCDGNCPSSCNDGDACTTDQLSGSPATCDAQCRHTVKTACVDNDGCCPAGCDHQSDNDCFCVAATCSSLGAECGTVSDGCGGTITCPNRCGSDEQCSQNRCVGGGDGSVGDPCQDYPDCGSTDRAVCILPPSWPGGYCSLTCHVFELCPAGTHCTDFDGSSEFCMVSCSTNSQCASGYECRDWDGDLTKECVPPQGSSDDEGAGGACGADGDCPSGYTCLEQMTGGGSTTTFPGGFCSVSCIPFPGLPSSCHEGDLCTFNGWCAPPCTTSLDCRSGYTCVPDPLGGSGSLCWP